MHLDTLELALEDHRSGGCRLGGGRGSRRLRTKRLAAEQDQREDDGESGCELHYA